MSVGSVSNFSPSSVPVRIKAVPTAKVTLLICMDLVGLDRTGTNAGTIYCALYDRKFDAVIATRRLVQLTPSRINNVDIPWANENIMEIYTDRKTEDLFLFLVKHANEKNSADYYGFDQTKLKRVANRVFKGLISKPEELPAPKATVDDVMDLFNISAKVNRRVMWGGHGSPDTDIAGMVREDFLKAHQRLNLLQPQIEGIVTCFVGGMHRLALVRNSHAHPVILFGSEDTESHSSFSSTWNTICTNLDRNPTPICHVKNVRALMAGVEGHTSFSVNEEPLVILPFQHNVRLINTSDMFSFVTAGSKTIKVPENKLAVLFTSYMAPPLKFNHHKSLCSGFLYSQIAGAAHHLFEQVQLPRISWDEFLKAMMPYWISSCRVKAFFIKKLSLSDVTVKNVIITNAGDGTTHMIYRLVKDNLMHYFVYRPCQEILEIDPFTYFCTALEILKDSKPSEEAVRLATGMSDEPSVYPAIKHSFLTAHPQLAPYIHIFKQFDDPLNSVPSIKEEITTLSTEKRVLLLALAEKYHCQPLISALETLERET